MGPSRFRPEGVERVRRSDERAWRHARRSTDASRGSAWLLPRGFRDGARGVRIPGVAAAVSEGPGRHGPSGPHAGPTGPLCGPGFRRGAAHRTRPPRGRTAPRPGAGCPPGGPRPPPVGHTKKGASRSHRPGRRGAPSPVTTNPRSHRHDGRNRPFLRAPRLPAGRGRLLSVGRVRDRFAKTPPEIAPAQLGSRRAKHSPDHVSSMAAIL